MLREQEINPWRKNFGIQLGFELRSCQTLLPLSHLDPWQRERKTSYISNIA